MTRSIICILIPVFTLSSPAGSFRLEGEPFQIPEGVEICWRAPTNGLPRGLWVYKTVPQTFSASVVSNLMVICGFQSRDIVKPRDPPIEDKNLICFRDSKGPHWSRYLNIAPTLGWIEYSSEMDLKNPPQNVPSREEAEILAQDYLFQIGIDRSLLCDMKNAYDTVQGKLDRDGNRLTTNIVARGVSYARLTDGVRTTGFCFMIHFWSNGKIKNFGLNWRNLQPFQARRVATPEQMIDFIRSGQAVAQIQAYDPSVSRQAKRINVIKITPHYFDKPGPVQVDFVYPYAVLEMSAEIEKTNNATFFLRCPILAENNR